MLSELWIHNFAIIDELHLALRPGLVVLTGETGAGKSIIVDAIELLLGGRAESAVIRTCAEVATVEGAFQLPSELRGEVRSILEPEGLWEEDGTLTLGREVRREGRNIARVNGRVVNLSVLREVGQYLVDVHGQSEHLSLLRVREHLGLLDRFAGVEAEREVLAAEVQALRAVREELQRLRDGERDAARRADMLTFQINEIGAAKLKPGEDEALLEERTRLANAEQLAALADAAILALDEGSQERAAATDLVGEAERALSALARIDATRNTARDSLQGAAEQLAELARELRAYRESIEFNPRRLEQVEERLELIANLKRKYGESIAAIGEYALTAQREMDGITHADERMTELAAQEEQRLRTVGTLGAALSEKRRAAGAELGRGIEAELGDLRMAGARFAVDIQWKDDPLGAYAGERRVAYEAAGLDRVEFLVAPNPGEGLKPLVKVASGGETSRLMLALKSVLAGADRTPTLIFDEIDQGIGGRVGAVVGRKLWNLTPPHQVLCVTHLPQLAGFGDQHLRVEKRRQGERMVTEVRSLSPKERVAELAAMLGTLSERTKESAEEILELVAKEKTTRAPS
ncbi:MAG: DNA repair protein RecN [Chloroflexi bacterium]|nr:DNA repair protein RecN [Chloroflexota bacterium]